SKPQEMKSANCISHTGRRPSTAAPTAAPMIAFSASGVSHTRPAPNSSTKPSVTLKAPPNAPMSSPRQKTVSSARISSRSPSEIAWRYVSSGIAGLLLPVRPGRVAVAELRVLRGEHALPSAGRVGHRLLERPLGLLLDLLLHRGANRLDVDAVVGELLLVAVHRVALLPDFEELLGHVAHVVVRAVAVHAHGLGLDQRRALAAARSLARLGGRVEDGLHVVAVHLHAREPIAASALDHVDRELALIRRRVGELVVLENEN